ncbi:unnamed protein product [Citrullus colocynthis]|uniref:Uncharacterized protein n=1 Tax=Citrullus colocynthis TaxID=252529 RepID=A0ABP0ZBY5_9ROSI
MLLMLSGNNFSGEVPKSILNIHRLLLLDLSRNRLSGDTFPILDPGAFLGYIDYSSNEFTGEIPTTFPQQTTLLSLSNNRFSGSLPKNLTNWTMLEHLDLHNNNISGELPHFLSERPMLQILSLRNNSLTSPIPKGISKLSILHILDLSSNNLVGRIPSEIGQLMGMVNGLEILSTSAFSHDIKLLNLAYNNLSGNIPSSFANLEHVETLDLSHNKLSGSIPESLAKVHQSAVLDVSNNELTSRIPVGDQMDTMNIPSYYANNSGSCGIQIQKPCLKDEQPAKPIKEEKKQVFSWIGAGIGFPVGFVYTVLIVYMSGFFNPRTPWRRIIRRT